MRTEKQQKFFEESGEVTYPSSDKLTAMFYDLLRDAVPGEMERIVSNLEEHFDAETTSYTNGYLAKYAKHLADRVRKII